MVPGILDLSRFPNKLGLSRSFIEEEGEGGGGSMSEAIPRGHEGLKIHICYVQAEQCVHP